MMVYSRAKGLEEGQRKSSKVKISWMSLCWGRKMPEAEGREWDGGK